MSLLRPEFLMSSKDSIHKTKICLLKGQVTLENSVSVTLYHSTSILQKDKKIILNLEHPDRSYKN